MKPIHKKIQIGNLIFDVLFSNNQKKYIPNILKHFDNKRIIPNKASFKIIIEKTDESISANMTDRIVKRILAAVPENSLSLINKSNFCSFVKRWSHSDNLMKILKNNIHSFNNGFYLGEIDSKDRTILINVNKKTCYLFLSQRPKFCSMPTFIAHSIFMAHSTIAPIFNSITVHCSAVSAFKKGYLFIGNSTAGKSTIAKIIHNNLNNSRILADDRAIINCEKNNYYIYSLPYDHKKIKNYRKTKRTKLNKIFILKKSDSTQMKPFNQISFLKEMMLRQTENNFWFPENMKPATANILNMIRDLRPQELFFPKNKSFIDFIM